MSSRSTTVRSTGPAVGPGLGAAGTAAGDSRKWLILAVICVAYLMVTLDVTVMTLALPSAQDDLGFTNVDRQWVVTAYALSFGSLLLVGGRLADLIGRKQTFLVGLVGLGVQLVPYIGAAGLPLTGAALDALAALALATGLKAAPDTTAHRSVATMQTRRARPTIMTTYGTRDTAQFVRARRRSGARDLATGARCGLRDRP